MSDSNTLSDLTIASLFSENTFYEVPIYQRKYKWGPKEQLSLWNDIKEILGTTKTHYFGTIILEEKFKNSIQLNEFSIIDGQQRLITLSIFLMAILKKAKEIDPHNGLLENVERNPIEQELKEFILVPVKNYLFLDKGIQIESKESELKLKLQGLDNTDYRNIINIKNFKPNRSTKENKIQNCFLFFYQKITEEIDKIFNFDDQVQYLKKISKSISTSKIIRIIPGNQEEIYTIFETLNNRGVKLSQIDLIRNYFIMNGGSQKRKKKKFGIKMYNSTWSNIDGNVLWTKGFPSSDKSEEILEFAFYWYLYQLPNPKNLIDYKITREIDSLYQDFKIHIQSEISNGNTIDLVLKNFWESFWETSMYYMKLEIMIKNCQGPRATINFENEKFSDKNKNQRLQEFADRVGENKFSWGIIFWGIFNYENLSTKDFVDIFKIFEMFIVRGKIVRPTSLQKNVTNLLLTIKEEKNFDKVKDLLINKIIETTKTNINSGIPLDFQISKALKLKIDDGLAKKILFVLEEEDSRGKKIIPRGQVRSEFSIELEHILPKAWRNNWNFPEETSVEKYANRDIFKECIGNFLLLEKPLNGSTQDEPFVEKIEIYKKNSYFLTKDFLEEYSNVDWNEDYILKRSEYFANRIENFWKLSDYFPVDFEELLKSKIKTKPNNSEKTIFDFFEENTINE